MLEEFHQPFEEIGSYGGFRLYSYQAPSDIPVDPLPPLVFEGTDFNGNDTIVGIDQRSDTETRHLICYKLGRCRYYFIYEGRHVDMTINKSELPDMAEFEAKLTAILDKHRLADQR